MQKTEKNWEMANYSSLNKAKSFHLMAFKFSCKIKKKLFGEELYSRLSLTLTTDN